jgi:hypothetical protein
MYIYSAQLQAKPGKGGKAGRALTELRDTLTRVSGQAVHAWAVVAGAPIGAYAVSTRVDSLEDLVDLQMKMADDEEYQSQAAKIGKLLAMPAETSLNRVVAYAGEPGDPKPMTAVTRATIAAGQVRAAAAAGNDMLELVSSMSGAPGLLTMSVTGNFNDLSWIFAYESAAEADAAIESVLGNAEYMERVDGMAGLFHPGSERWLLARMP